MANLDEDLDKPGAAPDGDVHFTSSTAPAGTDQLSAQGRLPMV